MTVIQIFLFTLLIFLFPSFLHLSTPLYLLFIFLLSYTLLSPPYYSFPFFLCFFHIFFTAVSFLRIFSFLHLKVLPLYIYLLRPSLLLPFTCLILLLPIYLSSYPSFPSSPLLFLPVPPSATTSLPLLFMPFAARDTKEPRIPSQDRLLFWRGVFNKIRNHEPYRGGDRAAGEGGRRGSERAVKEEKEEEEVEQGTKDEGVKGEQEEEEED